MAFTGSYICTSFYTDLLNGVFNFGSDTFRGALYTSSATLTAATTAYTATNELPTAGAYTAGGAVTTVTVSVVSTTSGNVVIVDFSDIVWPAGSLTARGMLVYDDTAVGNPAVMVIDFGSDITVDPFTVQFPAANPGVAALTFQSILPA